MVFLDYLIIVFVAAQAVWWAYRGFVRGFFPLAGFWAGMIGGLWISTIVLKDSNDTIEQKLFISLPIILGLAFIIGVAGGLFGNWLGHYVEKLKLRPIDSVLGALFSSAMTLVIVWFSATVSSSLPLPEINREIHRSTIIQSVNAVMPTTPSIVAKFSKVIEDSALPQIFAGLEPRPVGQSDIPANENITSKIRKAAKSTVRVEGLGCGGVMTGSGFFVTPELVATNAHVIAGIKNPIIVDDKGQHKTIPVVFDSKLDIAILKTVDVKNDTLTINNKFSKSDEIAAVIGYPGGGSLRINPARVSRLIDAIGHDIYDQSNVKRSIYEIYAAVEQGNSGGPLVNEKGEVTGVIVAKSTSYEDIGYAITIDQVLPLIETAKRSTNAAYTNTCV